MTESSPSNIIKSTDYAETSVYQVQVKFGADGKIQQNHSPSMDPT